MALDLTGFSLSWLFVRFVDPLFIRSSGCLYTIQCNCSFCSFCTFMVTDSLHLPTLNSLNVIHLPKKET
ncbi:hypothetical protein LDENG_00064720 [Lucifuga dentata]|nr:hypothetical protein LDENG_00064720 [Lucifuga dentata]